MPTTMKTLAKELGTDARTLGSIAGVGALAATQELTPEQEEQVRQAWSRSQEKPI